MNVQVYFIKIPQTIIHYLIVVIGCTVIMFLQDLEMDEKLKIITHALE